MVTRLFVTDAELSSLVSCYLSRVSLRRAVGLDVVERTDSSSGFAKVQIFS
jgi:hypothetical protein